MSLAGKLLGILPVLAVVMLLVATFGNAGTASAGEPYTRALTATLADGTVVTVEASTDAIPEGTTLEAKAVQNDAITEAVTAAAKADGTELTSVKAIDITLRDAVGNELEPSAAVKVTLSELGMNETGLSVYHVTAPDGNEAQATNAEDLNVEKVESSTTDANEQVFEAKSFSIYAIGETARLKVNFYQTDGSIKTIYVTKEDLDNNKLNDIVYDPGCGTLEAKQSFKGWTTDKDWTLDENGKAPQGQDIEAVRTAVSGALSAITFKDEDTLDFYPIVVKTFKVTYHDASGVAVHTDEVTVKDTDVTYTVNYAYSPDKAESRFDGWATTKGSSAVKYVNNAGTITFGQDSQDVDLYPVVVDGIWITFDGHIEGASYTAPVFVKYGQSVSDVKKIAEPTCTGWDFKGWFEDELNNHVFDFEAKIQPGTSNKTVYARWEPKAEATYTINYWKQSVTDSKDAEHKTYDFAESTTATAKTDSQVSGKDDKSDDKSYTGFHFSKADQDVTVRPDGSTVVNVYYDRDVMTINFNGMTQVWHGGRRKDGGWFDNDTLTIDGVTYEIHGGGLFGGPEYISVNGTRRYIQQNNGQWGYYTQETDNTSTSYTGLYGQTLAQNGYTWPSETQWTENRDGSGTTLTFLDAFLFDGIKDSSNWESGDGTQSITLYGQQASGTYTVNHYKQNLDGSYSATATNPTKTSGGPFTITNKYNGFTAAKYKKSDDGQEQGNGNVAGKTVSDYSALHIYYTRNSYKLTLFDGSYFNVDGTPKAATNEAPLSSVTALYEAPLSDYADTKPSTTPDGYVFAGWYKDKSCTQPFDFNTTMPLDGTKAYAKWIQTKYRVTIQPNGGDIGTYKNPSDIAYDGTVPEPQIKRDGYEFVGWYTDAACTQPFTFTYHLNTTTEGALGIATETPSDQNGYLRGSMTIYAKWRHVLEGADGITVVYDAGKDNSGTYTDSTLYQDQATASAAPAATYKDNTQKFQYWELNGKKIYPGDTFTVDFNDAVKSGNQGTESDPKYTYTVTLHAVYADSTPETTTVIFDANGGTFGTTDKNQQSHEVNTQITVPGDPTREGYDFIGWSGTKKDAWTVEEYNAATNTLYKLDANGNQIKADANGKAIEFAADNLDGLAWKAEDGTNVLYACWKKKPVTLTIQKELVGAQADLTKGYTFEVSVTRDGKTVGNTYTTDKLYDRQGENGEGQSVTLGGAKKTGIELLWGDTVTVTETDNTGYTTTYTTTVGDGAANNGDGTSTGELTLNGNGKVVFTNTKISTPVTAVTTADAPKVLGVLAIAGLAIAGGFALVQRNTLQAASAGAHSADHHATKRTDSNGNGRHMRGNGRRW